MEKTKSFILDFDAFCNQFIMGTEIDFCANFDSVRISDQAFPDIFLVSDLMEKEKLNMSVSLFLLT